MDLTEEHRRQLPWVVFFSHICMSLVCAFVALGCFVGALFFYQLDASTEQFLSYAFPGVVFFFHSLRTLSKARTAQDPFEQMPDGVIPFLVAGLGTVGFHLGTYIGEWLGGPVFEETGFGDETLYGPRVYLPFISVIVCCYVAVKLGALITKQQPSE